MIVQLVARTADHLLANDLALQHLDEVPAKTAEKPLLDLATTVEAHHLVVSETTSK
jgi:hypothetical protein